MLRGATVFISLLAMADTTTAGPWPREKGTIFASTSFGLLDVDDKGTQSEQGLYLEYGASPKLTLGFSGSYNDSSSGEGHFFARIPLNMGERSSLMAAEFGLGTQSSDADTFNPYAKTGLSWGRGIEMFGTSGWLTVDGAMLWGLEGGGHRLKLDTTLGLNLTDRVKVMGQSFIEVTESGETLSLQPSVVWTTKSGGFSLLAGLEAKTGTGTQTALRFALWSTF